ncbi:hypothetical protein POV27_08595 [Aureisphaera galaxeae]|uniref:hypothetical protein n=1 Tax=Aureisphaera galaxeae TaxID=1538023 RepID=UPI00234FF85C|nr:hypothetical protein [Aureisphaera galaxeae]MDC8004109.1 hypothetical protein [Aureisphaera galaxeae]
MTPLPPTTIDLDFVQVEIYDQYALLTIQEGIVFDLPKLGSLFEVFEQYYPDKPFGYISDRKFDFSVNPTCYLEVSNHPRLMSIAVLCHTESSYNTAQFEKAFYKRPFGVFYSMEECEAWTLKNIQESGQ